MSTKSHFIYEKGIEGFEETNESQSIFGKFIGYNAYLTIDSSILKSVKIKDEYIYIHTQDTNHLPSEFKIWGDAIIETNIDNDGLLIILKGGHHITKQIINKEFIK
jgi:hypothetical protein